MKNIIPFLILAFTLPATAQEYPLWKSLEAGPYQVGFTTTSYWQKEATQKSPRYGERTTARPVQISIWYPSEDEWSPDKALPFVHYFYLTEQKNDLEPLSEEQRDQAMDIFVNFARYGLGRELAPATFEMLRHSPTAAMEKVTPAEGRFPVLIAGHDGGVWKMSTLCEYLASHGYVIISTGPVSPTFQLLQTDPAAAIRRRMETYAKLEEVMDTLTYADTRQVGLLGLNFDGLTTLMYQMESGQAQALMSLDGWEGKNNGSAMLKDNFSLRPLKVPYLEIQQDESPEQEALMLNTSLFDSLVTADGYSLVIRDIGHAHLTGNSMVIPDLPRETDERNVYWIVAIRLFFDAYVKEESEAREELQKLIGSPPDPFLIRGKIKVP